MTSLSAIIGMLLGAITVVVWSNLNGGLFDLYEIIPGFMLASLAIFVVSLLRANPEESSLQLYDSAKSLIKVS
jgi:sodium/proline symporter